MSLSSTSTIKNQLVSHLGQKASAYFDSLSQFVSGKISRAEFDDAIRFFLDAPNLVQLHNALIISLFDATTHKRPLTPPQDHPKPPPRKRRRTLPYQGPDAPDGSLNFRSARLKRWTLSLGKRERERLRNLQSLPAPPDPPRLDEISRERGVILLPERGDPAGSRLPLHLASITRAPTIQHIADRINLICAQNNLGAPPKSVPSLMNLACEVKLKQLITHALTLTSTSHAISSIHSSTSSTQHHLQKILSTSAFETLFTVAPAVLPNKSAAAMRLAVGDGWEEDEDAMLLRDREVKDQRWQIVALLGERSTVKEALRKARR